MEFYKTVNFSSAEWMIKEVEHTIIAMVERSAETFDKSALKSYPLRLFS
jgi:hypothetical protein